MITLHDAARQAFQANAEELLASVKQFADDPRQATPGFDIHPQHVVRPEEIIGEIRMREAHVNGAGEEVARFFRFEGTRYGWSEIEYLAICRLVERLLNTKQLADIVSEKFLKDLVFDWLVGRLERTQELPLCDFICQSVDAAVEEFTLYVPLCRTYSSVDFSIGDMTFCTITRSFFDEWFKSRPMEPDQRLRVEQLENQTRATYQGGLAARLLIRAEEVKAKEVALEKAGNACALLRLLSLSNLTSKTRCFAMPLGTENSLSWHCLSMRGTKIEISTNTLDTGPHQWVVDESRANLPGLLEGLSDLASNQSSEFRRDLYEALIVYSRNSITTNPSDKLVFILVALESMLLKDASEPITGNLAERIAFLVGEKLEDRKQIVSDVRKTYAMRSKFIHHGQGIDDLVILDRFLMAAWATFLDLVNHRSNFQTRQDLIRSLDERKLS